MRIVFTVTLLCTLIIGEITAQPCTVTDASGCVCDSDTIVCDLLPDITVSKDLLLNVHLNPEEAGIRYISVSTPNIGMGPLRVTATEWYICGLDTFYNDSGAIFYCPDGEEGKQLIKQRVYKKDGDEMLYEDIDAGTMTYHPTHNHMHVDNWGDYTIREEIAGTDPLSWPIIGEGTKLGFCLMDIGTCEFYYGHCRDDQNNVITDTLPNNGLGGGAFTCGRYFQGISVGWTDIYHHDLPDMFVTIPDGVCNGDYMVVVHIDPNNNFAESNEENNVVVAPITLTKQSASGYTAIEVEGSTILCKGDTRILTAKFGDSFEWSNGETTASIEVTEPGSYSCNISTSCGTVTTRPIVFSEDQIEPLDTQTIDICSEEEIILNANTNGTTLWYSDSLANNFIGSGDTLSTNEINNATSVWIQDEVYFAGQRHFNTPKISDFQYSAINNVAYNGKLVFDVLMPLTIKSFAVRADTAGIRIFEVKDIDGQLIHTQQIHVDTGRTRINVDFDMEIGQSYTMGCEFHPGFYRDNIGVFFPYNIPDMLSVHGSTFGNGFYFYFYEWEIQLQDRTCVSELSEIKINYENGGASPEILNLPIKILNTDNLQLVGQPSGGVFSGEGITFNSFNPTVLNDGFYDITYTYNPTDNCATSTTQRILVYSVTYNFIEYNLGTIEP